MSVIHISAIEPADLLAITNNLPSDEHDIPSDVDAINRSLACHDEAIDELEAA